MLSETMVVQTLDDHGYELLSPYAGSENPILIRHQCGTERWVPLATLKTSWCKGTPGCPTCKSRKSSERDHSTDHHPPRRWTQEKVLETLEDHNFTLEGKYVSLHAPLMVKHNICETINKTSWFSLTKSFRSNGIGCGNCYFGKTPERETTVLQNFVDHGYSLEQPKLSTHVLVKHLKCGETTSVLLSDLYKAWAVGRKGCWTCYTEERSLSEEQITELLEASNRRSVDPYPTKTKDPFMVACQDCGHEQNLTLSYLSREPLCPKCRKWPNNNMPRYLYLIELEEQRLGDQGVIKIGVSGNLRYRHAMLSEAHGRIKEIQKWGPMIAGTAYAIESKIKALWNDQPHLEQGTGYTETRIININDVPAILKEIETNISKEYKPLTLNDFQVTPVDRKSAKAILFRTHYLLSCPGAKWYTGLWAGEVLLGVALYGHCSRQGTPSCWTNGNQNNTMELQRFALVDQLPPNTASWFLAQSLNQLPPEIEVIVTFADPSAGHLGGLYQAGNFFYLGETAPSYHYLDTRGKRIDKSSLRSSDDLSENERALGLTKIPDPPKHRYAYPRTKRAREALKSKTLPYPKSSEHP